MAIEIYEFAVTTPAGTAQAAYLTTALTMPAREVRRIEVKVPAGPRGALGFQFGQAGSAVIPRGVGQWVVTDDEVIGWDLSGQVDSGAWECYSYNTGQHDHTIYVRFLVDLPGSAVPPPLLPIPAAALGPAP